MRQVCMLLPTLVTLGALALLLVSEYRGTRALHAVAKPLASVGFVWAALAGGALGSRYGQVLLAALVLSLAGDLLLLSREKRIFRIGLFTFLLGHLAFMVAFAVRGLDGRWTAAAFAATALVGVPIGRWLVPRVGGGMRGPVVAYMVALSSMVALAAGTFAARGGALILVGAVAFYFSDLAVALDRFVKPGFHNRAWGLPLYYGAQLCLAWSLVG